MAQVPHRRCPRPLSTLDPKIALWLSVWAHFLSPHCLPAQVLDRHARHFPPSASGTNVRKHVGTIREDRVGDVSKKEVSGGRGYTRRSFACACCIRLGQEHDNSFCDKAAMTLQKETKKRISDTWPGNAPCSALSKASRIELQEYSSAHLNVNISCFGTAYCTRRVY